MKIQTIRKEVNKLAYKIIYDEVLTYATKQDLLNNLLKVYQKAIYQYEKIQNQQKERQLIYLC